MATEAPGKEAPVAQIYPEGKPISVTDMLAAAEPLASVEYVRTPGFKPGQVFVIQSVTAGDMIEWSEASEGEAKRTMGLRLIIKSVVDGEPGKDEGKTGQRILDDTHIALLRKLPHKATENVVKVILKLNGMNVPGVTDAKNA
jgi:hypothetical protein